MTTCRRRRSSRAITGAGVLIEDLESRVLLSAGSLAQQLAALEAALRLRRPAAVATKLHQPVARPIAVTARPLASGSSSPTGYTPAQIRHAYGIDQVMFGSIAGDGTGQTIAIIDAYHDPNAASDLHNFDLAFGMADPPSLRVVAQDGSANYPPTDPNATQGAGQNSWELEESLDLQWAHAIAPGANLILVEANDASFSNLVSNAVAWAKTQVGVTAISMSFGANEFTGESTLDSLFTTPSGHTGITYLASTGDAVAPGGYPAFSPNVVAVGGTSLTLAGSTYVSESGWSGSGGGPSTFESQPSYQSGLPYSGRSTPDVSMDADPFTGVAVYDSYDFGTSAPWITIGGTSLACPMWAGIISIVDQGRAQAGLGTLDGATQTLPKLYALPSADFHDVTTGSNGLYSAGPGYDLVTGRGSPVANLLIPDLVGVGSISGTVYVDHNGNAVDDAGDTPLPGVTVYLDTNNNGVFDAAHTGTFTSTNVPLAIPDNNATGANSTLTIAGVGTAITDLNINLTINHTFDRDLTVTLIAPDGTSLKLFSGIGGSGDNFTNTTLDDSATTIIGAAGTSAPFTGTFKPMLGSLLSAFNGHTLDGTWTLKVVDGARQDTGTLIAWSLVASVASEVSATSDVNGRYAFNNLSFGNYTVRQVVPAGYFQTQPSPGVPPAPPPGYALTVNGTILNQNFGDFPTTFAASGNGDGYTIGLSADGTRLQIYAGQDAPPFNATPTYSIALNELPAVVFSFTFTGVNENLVVNFANGSPLVVGNLTLDGSAATNAGLAVYGAGSAATQLSMTDTQIGPAGGSAILWTNLGHLDLASVTANYHGDGSNLPNVNINGDAFMYWFGP